MDRADGPDLIAVHGQWGIDRAAHKEAVGGRAEKTDQPHTVESREEARVVKQPAHGGRFQRGIKQEGQFKQSHFGELSRGVARQNPGNIQHATPDQFKLLGRGFAQ